MLRLIGDCHHQWDDYLIAVGDAPETVQIGDFGLGFTPHDEVPRLDPTRHRFERGNHDHPEKCRLHPNWIPDCTVEVRGAHTLMYVGGARSRDRVKRQLDIDNHPWWPDEELSYDELSHAVDTFTQTRPTIMVTHDCPPIAAAKLFPNLYTAHEAPSRTQQAFAIMLDQHSPTLWVFGHYHISARCTLLGTDFVALGILEALDLDI